MAEEAVAEQDGKFRAPFGEGSRFAAAFVAPSMMSSWTSVARWISSTITARSSAAESIAAGARGQQRQRGADALAVAVEGIADIARDAGIEFLHQKTDPLLDLVEVGFDRGEMLAEIELLGKERERRDGSL